MKKVFLVHARVVVPVWGCLEVEAETKDEAQKIALSPVDNGADDETEWNSKLWQDGEWMSDIRWEAADALTIENIVEDVEETDPPPEAA